MKIRLSRKAKIRRRKLRRSLLKKRNHDVVGIINRNGGGAHKGTHPQEGKAPKAKEWE